MLPSDLVLHSSPKCRKCAPWKQQVSVSVRTERSETGDSVLLLTPEESGDVAPETRYELFA